MKKFLAAGCVVVVLGLVLLVAKRGGQNPAEHGCATKSAGGQRKEPSLVLTSPGAVDSLTDSAKSMQLADGGKYLYVHEQLSAPVAVLLTLDGGRQNYGSIEDAVGQLHGDLSSADVAALRDFLTWSNDRFPEGMRPIDINAIKNDVLECLLRQDTLPEGIGLQLVEMASDPDNDPVWRDYCIQFMQPYYERAAGESGTAEYHGNEQAEESVQSVDPLPAVREAMVAALDERDGTIAGTSLIGLELLSRTHPEFDRKGIANSALDIASDESASAASRMTALRLLTSGNLKSETGNVEPQVAEIARSLARTGGTALLRAAAIVTLGEVGSDQDRALLEELAYHENQQISSAAKLALVTIDAPQAPITDLSQPGIAGESATNTQPEKKLPPILISRGMD